MLIVSTWALPGSHALAAAARAKGRRALAFDEVRGPVRGRLVLYSGTDLAARIARSLDLALLESPFDLLARLPWPLRLRDVAFTRLDRVRTPAFVKPADPLRKTFDAGVHREPPRGDPRAPVLVAEPVEWLAEYRCFVRERRVRAWSPYLSFGRPCWRPFERAHPVPANVLAVCERLFALEGLPPVFVVDVGLIDGRGWAVVEFNPAWCAGLLGCDPRGALEALERASVPKDQLARPDRRFVVRR